ncbi:Hypothetical predicted protein [Mytilus galloprovincialis]|uniref:Uncharacterized protein n=1 Tax=Mytilus galloprovincialis TaxID=29158 RepID=A0A8B6DGA2_MYTGA|nr:Hypothetical predicted protein [Mytilus galloprovincialis]
MSSRKRPARHDPNDPMHLTKEQYVTHFKSMGITVKSTWRLDKIRQLSFVNQKDVANSTESGPNGITQTDYRRLMKGKLDIAFTCNLCKNTTENAPVESTTLEQDSEQYSTLTGYGWHTRINSGKSNVSFYVLMPELMREADIVDLTLRLVYEEQVRRHLQRRFKDLEGRLHQFWKEYDSGEKTVTQLLRERSKVYGPSDD